jgi:uncharacterized membrane protein YfcA
VVPPSFIAVAYLAPGFVIGAALGFMTPAKLVYWVDPEGGPTAFLIFAATYAFVFWTIVFAVIYRWRKRRQRVGV